MKKWLADRPLRLAVAIDGGHSNGSNSAETLSRKRNTASPLAPRRMNRRLFWEWRGVVDSLYGPPSVPRDPAIDSGLGCPQTYIVEWARGTQAIATSTCGPTARHIYSCHPSTLRKARPWRLERECSPCSP